MQQCTSSGRQAFLPPPPPRAARCAHSPYAGPRLRDLGRASAASPRLILYTKRECPLCEGLQEKVKGLLARADFMPCALTGVSLEVRDITQRPEWTAAYDMEVPVLKLQASEDSEEVTVPRLPPRTSADRLQKHIEQAMAAHTSQEDT